MFLRQNTASQVICFGPFLDKTDGVALEDALMSGAGTGLDHAASGVMLSKEGGALAVRAAGFAITTYDARGCYRVTLGATDTNTLDRLRVIHTDATTFLPVWQDFTVLSTDEYDSRISPGPGTTPSQVDVRKWIGQPVTAVGQAGTPDVNVKRISDDTTAADNAELFFDGTGYAGTNNVIPTVTTVTTVTTLAGNTAQTGDSFARIGATGSGLTSLATAAALASVQADTDNIQTRIPTLLITGRMDATVGEMQLDVLSAAAIKADAVTEIQVGLATASALATVQADTDNIQTRLPSALTATTGLMKVSVEALLDDVTGGVEAATDLRTSAKTIVRGTASGTPTTTALPASDLPADVDDHYNGRIVIFTSGVLADQATSISDYVGSTKTLTIVGVTSAPAAGTTFVIV